MYEFDRSLSVTIEALDICGDKILIDRPKMRSSIEYKDIAIAILDTKLKTNKNDRYLVDRDLLHVLSWWLHDFPNDNDAIYYNNHYHGKFSMA